MKFTIKGIVSELKSFVNHCLLFRSHDYKEWFFGMVTWFCIGLFSYAVYNLIAT